MIYITDVKNNIRYYRYQLNLSQTELGDLIGLSQNSISALENGEFLPSLRTILSLMAVFNCSFYDLFDATVMRDEEGDQVGID